MAFFLTYTIVSKYDFSSNVVFSHMWHPLWHKEGRIDHKFQEWAIINILFFFKIKTILPQNSKGSVIHENEFYTVT